MARSSPILMRRVRGLMAALAVAASLPAVAADVSKLRTPARAEVERSMQRGREFLLKHQNKDGSWGSARHTKDLNIYAPVPGAHDAFRSGVTALCVKSLIEAGDFEARLEVKQALERGEAWLLLHLPKLRRASADALYNVWGHAYGIEALAAMHRRTQDEERRKEIRGVILTQLDLLRRYESVDGGWGYYDFRVGAQRPATDSTSFTTATALVAFHDAQGCGVEIPLDVLKRALASINRQKKPDHSYLYGEYLRWVPMMPINRPGGSLGRSQVCNLALRLWGDATITDGVLTNWLDKLVARNEWLSFGRKRPIPHESWFQVAGYFFYYGHYYAALCFEQLPEAQGNRYREQIAAILVPLQEKDGSWFDYPLYDYHQPYGTAYALMTLQRCKQGLN
jgi:hypothetical protein